jgi:hypothetical protein
MDTFKLKPTKLPGVFYLGHIDNVQHPSCVGELCKSDQRVLDLVSFIQTTSYVRDASQLIINPFFDLDPTDRRAFHQWHQDEIESINPCNACPCCCYMVAVVGGSSRGTQFKFANKILETHEGDIYLSFLHYREQDILLEHRTPYRVKLDGSRFICRIYVKAWHLFNH